MKPARDRFLEDAASILTTAEQAEGETGYTLLIGREGGLELVAESDWPLERLAAERGAERAYRVTHAGGRVAVEGRQGARRCTVASEPMAAVARRMLGGPALYRLSSWPGSC
jgi:hypothetical protein